MDEIGERIARIKSKLEQYLSTFDAEEEREGIPSPCLNEEEVAEYEQQHGVRLPEAYRRALLEIGNGIEEGEPFFYPLENGLNQYANPHLAKPFPVTESYEQHYEERNPEDYVLLDPEIAEGVKEHGSLTIRPDGCGREYRLIVSGDARGQVWYGDFGDACPCLPRIDFLAWYEAHLDVLIYDALHDGEGPNVEEIIFAGYNEDGSVKPE
jgi:hypothetical protein